MALNNKHNNKSKEHKEHKVRNFRLALIDDQTHEQFLTLHFSRASFLVAIVSVVVIFSAAIFAIVAYTPVRVFIPGYPDEGSKRAAIQNAIKVDSLENEIYKWELYSENLRRTVEGREPLKIDSIINARKAEVVEVALNLLGRGD